MSALTSYAPLLTMVESCVLSSNELMRIFHGRGHCYQELEHINLDFYPPFLFLVSYQELEEDLLKQLTNALWDISQTHHRSEVEGLIYQQRAGVKTVNKTYFGTLPDVHIVKEQGIQYQVDLLKSQNTGIFPDMFNGRNYVLNNSKSKSVLNLFSYTCGFSLSAMKGGAASVINMDMNKGVLKTGQINHKLNDLTSNVRFFPHDILKSFGKLKKHGPYDLIIIDPPSFQKGSFELTKDYQKILRRLLDIVQDGSKLLLCANSPDLSLQSFIDLIKEHAGSEFIFEERLKNSPGFPENDNNRNLKALIYRFQQA